MVGLNEQVRKYANMAHDAARAEINNEFEIKLTNLRGQMGSKGLSQSSVMDRECARLYADRVKALVQARADALIEGFELYAKLDEEAARAIIEDVTRLHESMTEAIGGTA